MRKYDEIMFQISSKFRSYIQTRNSLSSWVAPSKMTKRFVQILKRPTRKSSLLSVNKPRRRTIRLLSVQRKNC